MLQGAPRQVDEAGLHVVVEAGDLREEGGGKCQGQADGETQRGKGPEEGLRGWRSLRASSTPCYLAHGLQAEVAAGPSSN